MKAPNRLTPALSPFEGERGQTAAPHANLSCRAKGCGEGV